MKSSSATDRAKAVTDLRHILRHDENLQRIEALPSKAWHSIFEALFNYATTERAAYLKSKSVQRNTAHSRLTACASSMRTALELGVRKLRVKTIKAVLEHIISTLPTPDGFCEPLSMDYIKSMRTILDHQAHVEHLRDTWSDALTFCLSSLDTFLEVTAEESGNGFSNGSHSTSRTTIGTPFDRSHHRSSKYRIEVDELVICVRQLCRSPNAPIHEHAQELISTLTHYLQQSSSSSSGRVQVDALAAVNTVIARMSHTSVGLTRQALRNVLPIVASLWIFKSSHLRDEILSLLILTRSYLSDMLRKGTDTDIQAIVRNLLEVLQADYSKRPEREQLRLEDVRLRHKAASTIGDAPPEIHILRL